MANSVKKSPSTIVNTKTGQNYYGYQPKPADIIAANNTNGSYTQGAYSPKGGIDLTTGYNRYGYGDQPNNVITSNVTQLKDIPKTNTDTKTPTGGGTGSGSGSGTSASSGDSAYLGYLQLVQAQQAAEQRRAEQAAAAQRAAAQAAYDRGMSYLNSALSKRQEMLGNNFNSAVGQLENKYNDSTKNINADADASLKQAYINRMMNQKNLAQQMSAQGLSGGATESTLAKLYNNYGNSRNNIETTRNKNLSDLANTFSDNYANALQSYNNALAESEAERMQYAMNLENALANNEISTAQSYQNALSNNNSNYLNALADAVSNMARYNYTPSQATNDYTLANVIQAASNANSNYPNTVRSGGTNASGVTNTVADASQVDNSYLNALLRSLYGI